MPWICYCISSISKLQGNKIKKKNWDNYPTPLIPCHPETNPHFPAIFALVGSANQGHFYYNNRRRLLPIGVDWFTCPCLQDFMQPIKIPQSFRFVIVKTTRDFTSQRSSLLQISVHTTIYITFTITVLNFLLS